MSRVSGVRAFVLAGLVLGLGILLYPREVRIAPEWVIRVVDTRGAPVDGARVTEDWAHYDVARGSNVEHRTTDGSGVVVFPSRVVRLSLASQLIGRMRIARIGSVEMSSGPFAAAAVHYPDNSRGGIYPVSLPRGDARTVTSEVQVAAGSAPRDAGAPNPQ